MNPTSVRNIASTNSICASLTSTIIVDPTFEKRQIAWQFGSVVSLIQPGVVLKQGSKVQPAEERAMRLVRKHAPSVPVPAVRGSLYKFDKGVPFYGELSMDFIPGRTLKSAWLGIDEASKRRVCQDIWDLVYQIRSIPPPDDLRPGFYRTVDGSPSRDPLLEGSIEDTTPRDFDDGYLRNRIWSRYVACNGLSYRDGKDVLGLLPQSTVSVFTHGDIGPRNIMVDENCRIVALLDWEFSGWFPDYWEFAQMMRPCHPLEYEWQDMMAETKPKPWDIRAIQLARRVLF